MDHSYFSQTMGKFAPKLNPEHNDRGPGSALDKIRFVKSNERTV